MRIENPRVGSSILPLCTKSAGKRGVGRSPGPPEHPNPAHSRHTRSSVPGDSRGRAFHGAEAVYPLGDSHHEPHPNRRRRSARRPVPRPRWLRRQGRARRRPAQTPAPSEVSRRSSGMGALTVDTNPYTGGPALCCRRRAGRRPVQGAGEDGRPARGSAILRGHVRPALAALVLTACTPAASIAPDVHAYADAGGDSHSMGPTVDATPDAPAPGVTYSSSSCSTPYVFSSVTFWYAITPGPRPTTSRASRPGRRSRPTPARSGPSPCPATPARQCRRRFGTGPWPSGACRPATSSLS